MGSWGIRLNDRGEVSTEGEYATWRVPLWDMTLTARHPSLKGCAEEGCGFLVAGHQAWGKPQEGDVPEFTIEVAYKTKDHVGNPVTPGWRYIIKWLENGQQKQVRDYGFQSKESALGFAKEAAKGIALTLAPVHVETYRPEL